MGLYNIDDLALSKCLIKVKGDISLEEFKDGFYYQLRLNGKKYIENQYDLLLEALYQKDEKEYHDCYVKTVRMPLKYARENQELLANLINSNNSNLIQTAYDMYKRKCSVITRLIPTRVCAVTVKNYDKQLLCELENLLLSAKSQNDDNVIVKAKSEFSKFYSEYSNNAYLGTYYNNLLNGIEQEFFKLVNNEIDKIAITKARLKDIDITNTSYDDSELFEKMKKNKSPRHNIYRQTFK